MMHDLAYALLSGYAHVGLDGTKPSPKSTVRDSIFETVLEQFVPKSINVFQVGAIETFDMDWRIGSGWSDIFFGNYIRTYGGKLTVTDINLDSLSNSIFAAACLQYKIDPIYDDAKNTIGQENHDLYYLDGGNDPRETLDQFTKITNKNAVVVIDDYDIKGTLIEENFELNENNFKKFSAFSGIGVVDLKGLS